jgi:hypothetical protein
MIIRGISTVSHQQIAIIESTGTFSQDLTQIIKKKNNSANKYKYLLCPECWSIVGAHLGEAAAAGPGSHIAGVTQQVDRLEACGVVGTHRAQQHK